MAGCAIDGVVAENDIVSHVRIPQDQGFLRIAKGFFNIFTDIPQPVPDVVQVGFHTFFKMAHLRFPTVFVGSGMAPATGAMQVSFSRSWPRWLVHSLSQG